MMDARLLDCDFGLEDYWFGFKLFCYGYFSHSESHKLVFRDSKLGRIVFEQHARLPLLGRESVLNTTMRLLPLIDMHLKYKQGPDCTNLKSLMLRYDDLNELQTNPYGKILLQVMEDDEYGLEGLSRGFRIHVESNPFLEVREQLRNLGEVMASMGAHVANPRSASIANDQSLSSSPMSSPHIRPEVPATSVDASRPRDPWSPPPPPRIVSLPGGHVVADAPPTVIPLRCEDIISKHQAMFKMLLAILLSSIEIVISMVKAIGKTRVDRPKKRMRRIYNDQDTIKWEGVNYSDDEGFLPIVPHEKMVQDLMTWHIDSMANLWYIKPRSTCWFDDFLFDIYTSEQWYDVVRMRRRTFERLCEDLRPHIQGQSTTWREPISVEKKVVVTLYKLIHGHTMGRVACKAAIGRSTVHDILRMVIPAIVSVLGHVISWPSGRRLHRVTLGFQSKQWLPNCIGAIDGSHIVIRAPSNTVVAADHRNRMKTFSMLLQGICDSNCYFTSINTGVPGSVHDSYHLKCSELYRKAEAGTMPGLNLDPLTLPANLSFPVYLVGDKGYPLTKWLITPYKQGVAGIGITLEEQWFNRKHSSTRMCIERAFGILKGRFKELDNRTQLKLDFVPIMVHCCCILHNILIASKDKTLDEIFKECNIDTSSDLEDDINDIANPEVPRTMEALTEDRTLLEGKMAREDILDYLVRTQNAHFRRRQRLQ